MRSVIIDNTTLRVSRIAFGTAKLHHVFSRSKRLRLLHAAYDNGITHFDTSPYYGFGLAESDLGLFLEKRRDQVTVATKVGLYPPGHSVRWGLGVWLRKALGKFYSDLSEPVINWHVGRAQKSLEESLKRLRTEYVDVLFLHEPNTFLIDSEEFLTWLNNEGAKGKIKYWGLAGVSDLLVNWVKRNDPLSVIIQTKDSVNNKEADFLINEGRRLQFTYGYLSSALGSGTEVSVEDVLHMALKRNPYGAILYSTTRPDHFAGLSEVLLGDK
jgi:aryl-alcohol dehydrogenase-like predicted oxidoreductase